MYQYFFLYKSVYSYILFSLSLLFLFMLYSESNESSSTAPASKVVQDQDTGKTIPSLHCSLSTILSNS
jgi:hypothetical protein